MKFHFSLTICSVFFGSVAAFSQIYPSQAPFVEFSKEVAIKVAGTGDATHGILNCPILLGKQWAYPNAQVTAFCNEAETGCLRYALIFRQVKLAKGETRLKRLQRDMSLAWNDTQVRLAGCAAAIEASANNVDFISNLGGKPSYKEK